MNINKLLIKDSKGEPSVTMTAFVTGFLIVNLKLIASGMTIGGITLTAFTGGEYAAAVGALGAVYVLRRSTEKSKDNGKES